MANADSYIKSQTVYSEPEISPVCPQNQTYPNKFYSHFLFKAVLVTVLLVVIPIFPSQPPEFVNHSILNRSWELLHLLFVGIAVSYGLFSRRNVEKLKQNQFKTYSAQDDISRVLQVSPLFDDEVETPLGSDENKIQKWNSRCLRRESVPVFLQEYSGFDEISTDTSNKPLLLPVRSLKSSISDPESIDSVKKRSRSNLKCSSNDFYKTIEGEIGDLDPLDLEEKLKENVVLKSPIPWQTRSGRMQKGEFSTVTPPRYSLPLSVDESDFSQFDSRSFRSPLSSSSLSSSSSPSPNKLSPSPSLLPELRAKGMEYLGEKKSFCRSFNGVNSCKSPIISNSRPLGNGLSPEKKEMNRNLTDELEEFSKTKKEDLPRRSDSGLNSLTPKSRIKGTSIGKSVRTIRGIKPVAEVTKTREFIEDWIEEKTVKESTEVEFVMEKQIGIKTGGFDQPLMAKAKASPENSYPVRKQTPSKHQKEEEKEGTKNFILSSEDEYNTVSDSGADPDEVDKKADEFITKFREQIRLQRMISIKRANGASQW